METDHVVRRHPYYFHFVHWLVWIISAFRRKKNKRDRYPQSIGSFGRQRGYYTFKRFFKDGNTCHAYCHSRSMVSRQQMAGALSIPDFLKLVDVCCSGNTGNIYCIGNSKFPGNKSCGSKPCEEFENRIKYY